MPELPEVETVRRGITPHLIHQEVSSVEVFYPPITHGLSGAELTQLIQGKKLSAIYRRGKYLIFELTDCLLVGHLRMEGKLQFITRSKNPFNPSKHVHWVIHLANGNSLVYHDTRKFGRWHLYPETTDLTKVQELEGLGLEPIEDLPLDYFYHGVHHRHLPLKQLLLDQHILLGLGNIYADDTCFEAGIHPFTLGHHLTKKQCRAIEIAAKNVLERAIIAGGTTIRTYVASEYIDGLFSNPTKVYGRSGEPCDVCGSMILKSMRIGRSTHWCPTCQERRK